MPVQDQFPNALLTILLLVPGALPGRTPDGALGPPDEGSDEDDTGKEHDRDKGDGKDDENGALRYTELEPTLYRLEMADTRWCHVTSDRLDAEGSHQVETGKDTTAWLFTCVQAARPGAATGLLHSA